MTPAREIAYEQHRRERSLARAPRAWALMDRCHALMDRTLSASQESDLVGLLHVVRWYTDTGNEVNDHQAGELDAALRRLEE